MGVKIITAQQNKDRKIAKKIKTLGRDWTQAVKENKSCRDVDVAEAKLNSYLDGLFDAYGILKTKKLLEMSQEDLKQD